MCKPASTGSAKLHQRTRTKASGKRSCCEQRDKRVAFRTCEQNNDLFCLLKCATGTAITTCCIEVGKIVWYMNVANVKQSPTNPFLLPVEKDSSSLTRSERGKGERVTRATIWWSKIQIPLLLPLIPFVSSSCTMTTTATGDTALFNFTDVPDFTEMHMMIHTTPMLIWGSSAPLSLFGWSNFPVVRAGGTADYSCSTRSTIGGDTAVGVCKPSTVTTLGALSAQQESHHHHHHHI